MIMSFTSKYSQRLALAKAKNVKDLKDTFYWEVVGVFPRESLS